MFQVRWIDGCEGRYDACCCQLLVLFVVMTVDAATNLIK